MKTRLELAFKIAKDMGPLLTLLSLLGATIAYAHTTFSTLKYVDAKHDGVVQRLDDIVKSQGQILDVLLNKKQAKRGAD